MVEGSMKLAAMCSDPTARLTDDIIADIISRVPYKSTCCCKCVSTRWRSDYAQINYNKKELIILEPITVGFRCLRNTEFARDIGAAFASHAPNQAYLFKGNKYILLHFTPGMNKDYIINNPKEVVPGNWPSLSTILPLRNIGLTILESNPEPGEPVKDEL